MGIFQTINCWKVDSLHQPTGLKLKREIHFPSNSNLQFKRLRGSIVNWVPICKLPEWSHRCSGKNSQKEKDKVFTNPFHRTTTCRKGINEQKFESFIPMYLTFNFEENWRTNNPNINCHKTLHNTLHIYGRNSWHRGETHLKRKSI